MQPNSTIAVLDGRTLGPIPATELERTRQQQWQLGPVKVLRFNGTRRWRESSAPVCRLAFQCASRSILSFGERAPDAELTAGAWVAHVSAYWDVQIAWGGEVLALEFPAELLSRPMLLQLRSTGDARLPIAGAALMCLELARTCVAQAEPVSESVADALGQSLVEIAKLAIIEQSCTTRGETIRETVRTRILGFINRNLADPDLTIERIAERMHCTKRYLHKVFSEDGETLNQYIWSRRLELCRAQLGRADFAGKSITEIAFACGFSNAAHFSRSFRAKFGNSPRAYRLAALAN